MSDDKQNKLTDLLTIAADVDRQNLSQKKLFKSINESISIASDVQNKVLPDSSKPTRKLTQEELISEMLINRNRHVEFQKPSRNIIKDILEEKIIEPTTEQIESPKSLDAISNVHNDNINGLASASPVIGKTAVQQLNFEGSALKAGFYAPTNANGGGSGVTIMGYSALDVNNFTSYDNTSTPRVYPYSSAGSLNSNANLTSNGTGYYRMYFTTNPAGNYGSATAVTVNDASGNPIAGAISGNIINFTYDWTGNVQGGRVGGVDAAVTIVAGNAGKAKPVVATGILGQSKSISISLVAETDRAYTS